MGGIAGHGEKLLEIAAFVGNAPLWAGGAGGGEEKNKGEQDNRGLHVNIITGTLGVTIQGELWRLS